MSEAAVIRAALAALTHAHAPYSKFRVGAAVESRAGRIYAGANVENASYGLSICAERSAICSAVSAGEREFVRVAVVTSRGIPTAPCGACLQFLAEFATETVILLVGRRSVERVRLSGLLPHAFRLRRRALVPMMKKRKRDRRGS